MQTVKPPPYDLTGLPARVQTICLPCPPGFLFPGLYFALRFSCCLVVGRRKLSVYYYNPLLRLVLRYGVLVCSCIAVWLMDDRLLLFSGYMLVLRLVLSCGGICFCLFSVWDWWGWWV